jgi:hypothetical protein
MVSFGRKSPNHAGNRMPASTSVTEVSWLIYIKSQNLRTVQIFFFYYFFF